MYIYRISSKRHCGYYLFQLYRNAATIRWRLLFEGGYYSKYRRRGYYLFQLYRNAATIQGWLLFEVQTSRLLFISALPQCGDYSRVALPQCGDYSRVATIRSTDVAATIYFSSTAMRRLFKGGYYSKYRRRGYYLFQRYRNAVSIRRNTVSMFTDHFIMKRKPDINLVYT